MTNKTLRLGCHPWQPQSQRRRVFKENPCSHEKLAQSVEQLPFKEWVPGSIPGLLKAGSFRRNDFAEGLVPFV